MGDLEPKDGLERNGSVPNGLERNGSVPNGSERNGSERNGSERNGSVPNGSERIRRGVELPTPALQQRLPLQI